MEDVRGDRLRKIREKCGLTQAQVIDILRKDFGIKRSTMWLCRLEKDKVTSLKRIDQEALARIYSVTPEYIMDGGKITLEKVYWLSPKVIRYIENPKNKNILETTIRYLIKIEEETKKKTETGFNKI